MLNKCVAIDIESSGLLEDMLDYTSFPYKLKEGAKIWVISFTDVATMTTSSLVLDEITKEAVDSKLAPYEYILQHNGIKFDLLTLKLFGLVDYKIGWLTEEDTLNGRKVRFIDTLILSRLLNPTRFGGHSLKSWGERVGDYKDDYRGKCIEAGIIDAKAVKGEEFKKFNHLMPPYCEQDTIVTAKTFLQLLPEYTSHQGWKIPFKMESKLADLAVRREHLGFWFDKDLAIKCVEDLTQKMEELRGKVNPLLPSKPMTKTELSSFTPPATQFLKSGKPSTHIIKFAERVGGRIVENEEKEYFIEFENNLFKLPFNEPLKTHTEADISNLDHVKMTLISKGWNPSDWRERDFTKDSKKISLPMDKRVTAFKRWVKETVEDGKYKKHRLEIAFENYKVKTVESLEEVVLEKLKDDFPVRLPTSPNIRVGVEKELCPELIKLGDKVEFAKDFALYLTYKHRKSSIAGGDIEDMDFDEESPNTGYLSVYREIDGRVPTPAIEIGANCVVKDTEILTLKGYKKIVDININDEVLTHEGIYARVIDLINNGIKPVYTLKTAKGLSITCTENHPFMTQNGWVKLKDLDKNVHILKVYGEKEIWGKHPLFSNYTISSFGRILDKQGRELKGTIEKSGFLMRVELYDGGGNRTSRNVGKVVCETFRGLCPEGLEIRHLDGNPFNNNIQNLKFGTSKENSEDTNKHRKSRRLRKKTNEKITDEQIREMRMFFEKNEYNRGQDEYFGKKYGVSRKYINEIRRGTKRKEYDYYKERFEDDKIVSIEYVGEEPTFDITVRKFHSYVANSIVTHNTSRYKHVSVANIPRATSEYGKEMRSLFGCGSGAVQLGFDYASLEARIQGHYCWNGTDGKELSKTLLAEKPFDVHTITGQKLGIPRSDAKSVNYMLMYGGSWVKAKKMLNLSDKEAKDIVSKFWESMPALKELKESLETQWKQNGEKFIYAIDGRKLWVRSKHSIINLLFQSGGVICAKYVTVMMMEKLEKSTYCIDPFLGKPDVCSMIEYHDEAQLYCNPKFFKYERFSTEDEAKEFVKNWKGEGQLSDISFGKSWYITYPNVVTKVLEDSVGDMEKLLKLNVPLGYAFSVSNTWYGCH